MPRTTGTISPTNHSQHSAIGIRSLTATHKGFGSYTSFITSYKPGISRRYQASSWFLDHVVFWPTGPEAPPNHDIRVTNFTLELLSG